MRQKVDVQDLKPGMYVSELDRPWRDTPFLFQGFYVDSHADVEQIRAYCKFVYIDTAGSGAPPRKHVTPHDQKVELEMLRHNAQRRPEPVYPDTVSVEEELEEARDTYLSCRETIGSIMDEARMGNAINTERARKDVDQLMKSVIRNPDALMCLMQMKKKNEYTLLHSLRVAVLALSFGRHLGLSEEELSHLGLGALLHDIGKLRVPNEILNKPGRLTGPEFEIMKRHVPEGVKILEKSKTVPATAIEIAAQHHERSNGKGYIYGLRGEQIGRAGMITAIVDCYDALTSDRAFQEGISAHHALKKMYTWRSTDFHAGLVEQFIQCIGIYPVGSLVEMNTGHVGVVIGINRRRYLRPKINLILDSGKKAYPNTHVIDLATRMRDDAGAPWEIRSVLEPGTYGLNPSAFLPKITTLHL